MDPNWLTALVAAATLLLTILGAMFGKILALSNEVAKYKTHVAETYATKEEIKDGFERLERQMSRIYDALSKRDAA